LVLSVRVKHQKSDVIGRGAAIDVSILDDLSLFSSLNTVSKSKIPKVGSEVIELSAAIEVPLLLKIMSFLQFQYKMFGGQGAYNDSTEEEEEKALFVASLNEHEKAVEKMITSWEASISKRVIKPIKPKERIWRCSFCTENFQSKDTMTAHGKKFHNEFGVQKYVCIRCPKIFKSADVCNIHYNTHIFSETRVGNSDILYCQKCNDEFINEDKLKKHEQMHAQIKCRMNRGGTWLCEVCKNSFWKKSDWTQHILKNSCIEKIKVTRALRTSIFKLSEFKKSLEFTRDYYPRDFSYPSSSDEIEVFGTVPGSVYFSSAWKEPSNASDGSVEDCGESEFGMEKPEDMVKSATVG